jgi:hypothetical protein
MRTKSQRYESPSHGRLQQLKVRVPPEVYSAFAEAAAAEGVTKQDAIAKLCEQYARARGIPVPRPS